MRAAALAKAAKLAPETILVRSRFVPRLQRVAQTIAKDVAMLPANAYPVNRMRRCVAKPVGNARLVLLVFVKTAPANKNALPRPVMVAAKGPPLMIA